MIGYTTLGTNDITAAAAFYDELLGMLGGKRSMESDSFVAWSSKHLPASFGIAKPHDGNAATAGNGTMIALAAGSNERAAECHAKALELGGTDEGAPGPRGDGGFYAAYCRDLDGNKLCFFHINN